MNTRDFEGVDTFDTEAALAPQRTSVLAILSLIFALLCPIPAMGLLAVIFGISAMIGISSSRGRVGGTGLAVSGLVLGLIVTMIQVAIAVGASQVLGMASATLTRPASTSFTAIDSGDFKNARTVLTAKAGAAVTDEQLQAFRSAYQGELGSFKSMPQGWDLIASYMQIGPMMQQVQGRNDVIPLPASFDKGMAVVLLKIDPNAAQQRRTSGKNQNPMEVIQAENLIILTPAGNTIELIPNAGATSPPPGDSKPATEPPPSETPSPPAAPAGK